MMSALADLQHFIPKWDTLFLNLRDTKPETLTRVASAIGWALRVLQAEREPLERLEETLRMALSRLEELTEEQAGQWQRVTWYLLLLIFHRRSRSEYSQLEQTLWSQVHNSKFREKPEVEKMSMTMAEFVESRGATNALREILQMQLEEKFGPLPGEIVARVANAPGETLRSLLRNMVTARTIDEVGFDREF